MPSVQVSRSHRSIKRVVISGAGPAGLLSALMLKNAGIGVTLLERVPKSKLLSDVGGAYDLYPNTMRIFRQLDLFESIAQKSDIFKTILMFNQTGKLILNVTTSNMLTSGQTAYSALRSVIQQALLENITADIDLKCGTKAIDYIENPDDNTIKVISQNTENENDTENSQHVHECDLCIVADGIWSKLGSKLVSDTNKSVIKPNYCSAQAWWGRNMDGDALPQGVAHVWLGPGKSFVAARVESAEGVPMTICTGFTRNEAMQEFKSNKERKDTMSELMDDFGGLARDIIDGTEEDDILDVGIYDRDRINTWANKMNNVILTGDAAHPMTPMLGQGANSALTDAFILVKLLEKYGFDKERLGDVVKEYELRMDPMYNKIVKPARSMCKYMLSDSKVIHNMVTTWIKYGPAAYLAPEIANGEKVNDITDYL